MRRRYEVQAGLVFLLSFTVPTLCSAQGIAGSIDPLGAPTGSFVLFSGGVNAFGSGWGQGTLTFQGQTFKFTADGIRPVGPTKSTDLAEGEVYNLQSISDFPGFFSTMDGSRGGSNYLQNEHYVTIHITKSRNGVMFRTMDQPVHVELPN